MARGRKAKTRFTMTGKDKTVLQAIAKCGAINREIAQTVGIGSNRLSRMEKEGLIKQKPYFSEGQIRTAYQLTPYGQKFVKAHISSVHNFYKPTGKANHDIALCKKFIELPQERQNMARTETDIAKRYGRGEKGISSVPDLYIPKTTVETDTETIHYCDLILEAVTNNYGEEEIQAKINYVQQIMNKERAVFIYEKAN